VSAGTFDRVLAGLEPDSSVLEALDAQPEFVAPIWDYLAALVDDKRIADGRQQLEAWSRVLRRAEKTFGVDRHVLVAVWGVETNFGRNLGRRPMVRSLATVSCFGRRQPFFRQELLATLRIVESGDMPLELLSGSWAGAFGQTQFMPTTFQRVAVDFDGDGRRDIVGSVPDALASTANYLKQAGWEPGRRWGHEVRLPAHYEGPSGRVNRKPLAEWRKLGIRRADGKPLEGDENAALLLPAGVRGPAFIVFKNFDAVHAYNPSEAYSLAIVHLADRLRGAGTFKAAWPTDDPALSRAERMELQEALAIQGFDPGEIDGIIGPRTLEAIKEFQRSAGMTPDGYPGAKLLKRLRSAPL
jgi:lytic murein transglycosylase